MKYLSHVVLPIILLLGNGLLATAQSNYTTPYTVTILAGSAASGSVDGVGNAARFTANKGMARDSAGNLYVVDQNNRTIRKITPTGMVTTFVGTPGSMPGAADGQGAAAQFGQPIGVGIDGAGNLYVADWYQTIRKITTSGFVSTFAGLAHNGGGADGVGSQARFGLPTGVAVDESGNVYIADQASVIRKISPVAEVATLAGTSGQQGWLDGTGSAARFRQPFGITVDNLGIVYVVDWGSPTIRKITPDGLVTTLAGSDSQVGSADGEGLAARFRRLKGIVADRAGNLFVTDYDDHTVRRITASGTVSTIAGSPGLSGDGSLGPINGTGGAALFQYPHGIVLDDVGNLYVADDHLIRKCTPPDVIPFITLQPISQVVATGSSVRFISGATGGPTPTFQWLKDGVIIPGANKRAFALDNVGPNEAGSYAVVATNPLGSVTSNVATLNVISAPGITVQPVMQHYITAGGQVTFSVTATGYPAPTYQWKKNGVNISGAIGSSYTIGNAQVEDAGSYTVVVTNSLGTVASSGAVLTIVAASVAPSKVLGDFNGDGKADLVWTNTQTGERSMWFLNGNAQSGGASLGMVPVAWVASATADFDRDGKADIFWTNTMTGDRAVWLMSGSVRLTNTFMGTVPADWTISGTGDFNGDGKADLVWTNSVSGDRAMWLMNGSTVLGGGYLGTVPVAWVISGVGDFDGDGKADLVWSNAVTGERSMWFQNGSTTNGGATLNTVPVAWAITGVGDFNGDGKADIFLSNATSGDRVIWLMNGSTITTNAFMGTVPVEWTISGTGDFNGDGKKDLFWTNAATGDRAMWLLNGATVLGGGFMGTVPVVWKINN